MSTSSARSYPAHPMDHARSQKVRSDDSRMSASPAERETDDGLDRATVGVGREPAIAEREERPTVECRDRAQRVEPRLRWTDRSNGGLGRAGCDASDKSPRPVPGWTGD